MKTDPEGHCLDRAAVGKNIMRAKRAVGRPNEGRVRVNVCILPATARAIRAAMDTEANTLGKVVDRQFFSGRQ